MKARIDQFFLLFSLVAGFASPFGLPNLSKLFKPPSLADNVNNLQKDESALLNLISSTDNGKNADTKTQLRILSIVRRMETLAPPTSTLLSNPEDAKILDGDWYLRYTSPSNIDLDGDADVDKWVKVSGSEGESRIDTKDFNAQGTVSAAGITVDTSNKTAKQSFDIKNKKVMNEVMTPIGLVTVGGTFRQSKIVPLRAVVAFETAKLALNFGLTLDLSFLFDIRGALKGTKEAGWVETTYINEKIRIGRGNKGSLFVLTRDPSVSGPSKLDPEIQKTSD